MFRHPGSARRSSLRLLLPAGRGLAGRRTGPFGLRPKEMCSPDRPCPPAATRGYGTPTAQADSRWRPFRRRLFRMARPWRVRLRCRNPCLRFLRRLFGWYVRFIRDSLYRTTRVRCPVRGLRQPGQGRIRRHFLEVPPDYEPPPGFAKVPAPGPGEAPCRPAPRTRNNPGRAAKSLKAGSPAAGPSPLSPLTWCYANSSHFRPLCGGWIPARAGSRLAT